MPLLALEPSIYPEQLFDQPQSPPAEGACWWVLCTKPRTEKCLARKLLDREVAFYLPLCTRRWTSGKRRLTSHLPLFPGYVFLFGGPEARLEALKTNLLTQVLPVVDQDQLHADLVRVHRLQASGAPLTPEDRLSPGARVCITQGAFTGLEGKLLRRDGELRFLVEVQLLQRGVSLVIESGMFEPLDPGQTVSAAAGPGCG
jgi:hypothetical protein